MKNGLNIGRRFYKILRTKNNFFKIICLFLISISYYTNAETKINSNSKKYDKSIRSGNSGCAVIKGKIINQNDKPVDAIVICQPSTSINLHRMHRYVHTMSENGVYILNKVPPGKKKITIITQFGDFTKEVYVTNGQDIALSDTIVETPLQIPILLSFVSSDGTSLIGATVWKENKLFNRIRRFTHRYSRNNLIAVCEKMPAVVAKLYINKSYNIKLTKDSKNYMAKPFIVTNGMKKLILTVYPKGSFYCKALHNSKPFSMDYVVFTHEKTGYKWGPNVKEEFLHFPGPEGLYEISCNRKWITEQELFVGKTNIINFQTGSLRLQFPTQVFAEVSAKLKMSHKEIEILEKAKYKSLLRRIKQPTKEIYLSDIPAGRYNLSVTYTTLVQRMSINADILIPPQKTTNFKINIYETE